MYSVLLTTVAGFAVCLLLTPAVRAFARRRGIVDQPDGVRKLHRLAVPRIGGIAIVVSYVTSYLLLLLSPLRGGDWLRGELATVCLLMPAVGVAFFTGLLDDLRSMRPGVKIAGQLAAASLAYWAGVRIASVAGVTIPEWGSLPLTLLWLVGCANAFNLIDGVDGLATGVGLLTTLTVFGAALLQQNTPLALATAPLAGCLLGFLRYNFNPASIFLGDSGSLSIGFLLGCYGVIWSQKSATILGMSAPLMALSIPLLDTALAILRRFLRGRPIFGADRGHVHHRLLDRGLTPRRVALLLYGACGLAAAFSLITTVVYPPYAGVVLIAFLGTAWLGVHKLGYAEFSIARQALLGGGLQNIVNSQISLQKLGQAIAVADDPTGCWKALRKGCEDLGISHIGMQLAGRSFHSKAMGGPVRASWYAVVPLSDGDHVVLGSSARCEGGSSVLGPLIELVQTSLRNRLAEMSLAEATGGPTDPTESLLRLLGAVRRQQGLTKEKVLLDGERQGTRRLS